MARKLIFILVLVLNTSGCGQPTQRAIAIAAGEESTCVVTASKGVKCWGGDNTTPVHDTPVEIAGLTSGVTAVAAGSEHSCALTAAGGVKCWGSNDFGQLGDNTRKDRSAPVGVVGFARA